VLEILLIKKVQKLEYPSNTKSILRILSPYEVLFVDSIIPNLLPDSILLTLLRNTYSRKSQQTEISLWDQEPEDDDYTRFRHLNYIDTDVFFLCFSVTSRISFESIKEKVLNLFPTLCIEDTSLCKDCV
jgi:hypothetical protein